jgi:hypothetical protein
MLRENAGDTQADFVIADYSPVPVRDGLIALGIPADRIHIGPAGSTAIELLTRGWTEALSGNAVLTAIRSQAHGRKVVLAWGDSAAYAPVERVILVDSVLIAVANEIYPSFAEATAVSAAPAWDESALLPFLDEAVESSLSLHARVGATSDQTVIHVLEYTPTLAIGQGAGRWLVLQVAATPPGERETATH